MATMTRRRFAAGSAALPAALALAGTARAAAKAVRLPDGTSVPALGQGSWHLGSGRRAIAEEEAAMAAGLSLGLTLIDTAEIYGGGKAETMIGRVIAGKRDEVFLVSKVAPTHATPEGIRNACAGSLKRLGTDHLDLYLLHWRSGVRDLAPVVKTFGELREAGRIRRWGVSNFSVSDMEELMRVPGGDACAANQVVYSLADRGIERDLIPWCQTHRLPIMAYSPLGGAGSGLLRNAALTRLAAVRNVTPAALALAWTMRSGLAISIPESGSVAHVRENAAALTLDLSEDDLRQLDQAFPA